MRLRAFFVSLLVSLVPIFWFYRLSPCLSLILTPAYSSVGLFGMTGILEPITPLTTLGRRGLGSDGGAVTLTTVISDQVVRTRREARR